MPRHKRKRTESLRDQVEFADITTPEPKRKKSEASTQKIDTENTPLANPKVRIRQNPLNSVYTPSPNRNAKVTFVNFQIKYF